MSDIRALDIDLLDALFGMGDGYVLDFSNLTFSAFFRQELRINIDDPRHAQGGTSKAKRLRYFLQTADNATAVRVLIALWKYRETKRKRARQSETVPDADSEFWELVVRLGGKRPPSDRPSSAGPAPGPDKAVLTQLSAEFVRVSEFDPQRRGYEFERFLKSVFNAYGLDPRSSFRNVGEQIDGSFQLHAWTYLVEARWRSAIADAAALHSFHGKIDQKADWSRGLFISMSGFSPQGLVAFGRAKKLICMDGFDLYEILSRGLPFDQVIDRKARRAAETGAPYVSVRELF